ncbi:MAG: VOC family protein [Amphritea sp.]|nr:VOC family protein [Amphritea sp.]
MDIVTANTILYCDHWQAAVHFYEKLGFSVLEQNSWFVEFGLTDQARLSVANAARASINSGQGKGLTITLQVADVRGWLERVRQLRITSEGIKRHGWGAEVFYIFDPEGNRIEFWCPVNDDG